jgi:hypothetical protein
MAEETFMFAVTAGIFALLAGMLFFIRAGRHSQATMNQSPSQIPAGDLRLWIYLPMGLIIILGIILWFPYEENQRKTATEAEPKVATIWGYIESETFRAILTVLVIPIFLFLLERRFKILENLEASRREKQLSRIKANRDKRIQTISDTISMWDEVYNLALEVVYYETSCSDANNNEKVKEEKVKVRDLSRRILGFPNKLERVINQWLNWFPNLSNDDLKPLVDYFNRLWFPTVAVGHFLEDDILNNKKSSDTSELQLSLNIIRGKIKTQFHHGLISVMNESNELLMIIEDNMPDQTIIPPRDKKQVEERVQKITNTDEAKRASDHLRNIQNIISVLSQQSKRLEEITMNYQAKALFNVEEQEKYANQIEQYRKLYEDIREWIKENRSLEENKLLEQLRRQHVWQEFGKARDSIPRTVYFTAFRYPFTRQNIKDYAYWVEETNIMIEAKQSSDMPEQQKNVANSKKLTAGIPPVQ